MAKETKFENGSINLGDDPELDSFDFDYDEDLFGDDLLEEEDSREPVTVKNVAKNIKKKFKETSAFEIQAAIEDTMPSKIKGDYAKVKDVFSNVTEEITGQSAKIKSELKDLSGKLSKFLPEGNKLKEKLEKFSQKEAAYSGPSAEDRRENEIMENVASSLGNLQQVQEQANMLNNILEDKRTESTNELLKELLKSSNATKLFNFEYTSKWQRKSLELSYRQTYFLKDLLEVTKENANKTYEQLTAITKNTALPDIVKQHQSELMIADIKKNFRDKALGMFVNTKDALMDRVKANLVNRAKEIGGDIQDQLFMANNQLEMMQNASELDSKSGNIAGMVKDSTLNFGANALWNFLGKSNVGKKAFRFFKNGVDNPANIFRSLNDKLEGKEFFGSDILKTFLGEAGNALDVKVDKMKVNVDRVKLDDPAIFDNRIKKTVVNVIPGYLRKIHAEIAALRAGDRKGSIEKYELSYSYDSDTFTSKAKAGKEMIKNFRKVRDSELENPMNNIKKLYTSDKMLEKMGKDKLTKKELDAISKAATIASTKTTAGGLELLKSKQFMESLPEEMRDKVSKATSNLDELALDDLDVIEDARYYVDRIRSSIPSMVKDIEELFHNGNIEELTALGIVKYDPKTKSYSADEDKIFELMFGDYGNLDFSKIKKDKDKNLFNAKKTMIKLKKKQRDFKKKVAPKIEEAKKAIKEKTQVYVDKVLTKEQQEKIKEEAKNIKQTAKSKIEDTKEKLREMKDNTVKYMEEERYIDDYKNIKEYVKSGEYKKDVENASKKYKEYETKMKEETQKVKEKYKSAHNSTKEKLQEINSRLQPSAVFSDNNTVSNEKKEETYQEVVQKEKDVYASVELLDSAEATGDKQAIRSAMDVITKKGLANNSIIGKKFTSAMQSIRNKEAMANNMAKEIEKEKDPEKKMTLMRAAGKFAGMLPYSSVFKMLWGGMKMYVKAGRALERFLLPKLGKGLMKIPGVAAAGAKFAGLVGWNSLKHSVKPAGEIAKMGVQNIAWSGKQIAKAPFALAGGIAKGLGNVGLWGAKKLYGGIEAAFAPEGDGPEFHGYDDYYARYGRGGTEAPTEKAQDFMPMDDNVGPSRYKKEKPKDKKKSKFGKLKKGLGKIGRVGGFLAGGVKSLFAKDETQEQEQQPEETQPKKKGEKQQFVNGLTKEEFEKRKNQKNGKDGKGSFFDKILSIGGKILGGIGSLVGFFTKKFAGLLASTLTGALSKLGSLFNGGGDLPDGPDKKKKGFFGRLWDGAKNVVKKGVDMAKSAAGYVATGAVAAYNFAKEKTVAVAKKIGNIVSSAWDLAKHIGGKAFNAVKGALSVIGQTAGELINKCTNALKGLKDTLQEKVGKPLLKRLGKVGAKKAMVKLAAKITARLVPVTGLALLAWDLVVIAKEMAGGRPFLNSLVYGLIGFDPWDESTGDTFVDDDGSTIKPDKDVAEQNAKEDNEPTKAEGEKKEEDKPIPQPKGSKIISGSEKTKETSKPKNKKEGLDSLYPTYDDKNSNITAEEMAMMDGVKTKYQIEQEELNRKALEEFEKSQPKDSGSNLTDEELAMLDGTKTPYQIEQERMNREVMRKLDEQEKAEEAEMRRVEKGKKVNYSKPVSAKISENKAIAKAINNSQPKKKKITSKLQPDKMYKLFVKACNFLSGIDVDEAYLVAKAISNLNPLFDSKTGFGIFNIDRQNFEKYYEQYKNALEALGGDWPFGDKNYLDPWQQVFTGLLYFKYCRNLVVFEKDFPTPEDIYSVMMTKSTGEIIVAEANKENGDNKPSKYETEFRKNLGFSEDSDIRCYDGVISGTKSIIEQPKSEQSKQKPKPIRTVMASKDLNTGEIKTTSKKSTSAPMAQPRQSKGSDNSDLIAAQKEAHSETINVQQEGNNKLDKIADILTELVEVNKGGKQQLVNGKTSSIDTSKTSVSQVPPRHFNNNRGNY